jgi:hypothetical protein
LHEALRDGVLDGYVRDPDTGELFRQSGPDWHSLRLWRETIISGFVRAWPEDLLVRHEGRRVLLSAAEFAEWLKAFKAVVPSSVASLPTPSAPEQSPGVAPSSAASPPTPEAPEQPCSPGEAGAQLQASKIDGIVGPAPGLIPEPLPPSQGSAGPDDGGPEAPKPPPDIEPISVSRAVVAPKGIELPSQEATPASAADQAPVPAARFEQETTAPAQMPRQKRSRSKTIYCGAQTTRAKAVLKRMFPNGEYPSREELPTPDLLNQFSTEYDRVEGMAKPRSRLGKPSDSVVLREVGRKK